MSNSKDNLKFLLNNMKCALFMSYLCIVWDAGGLCHLICLCNFILMVNLLRKRMWNKRCGLWRARSLKQDRGRRRRYLLRKVHPPLSHHCLHISEHLTATVNLVSLSSSTSHMESWSDFWRTARNIWSGSNWQLWHWAWLWPLPRILPLFLRSNYNFTGWN